MDSDNRCPACYSLNIVTDHSGQHTCRLCGLGSADPDTFSNWRHFTPPAWMEDERVVNPNPNDIWRRSGVRHGPSSQVAYPANAVTAILERRGVPVLSQQTVGILGLPVPLGRWGEQLVTRTAPQSTAPPVKGKLTIGGICVPDEAEAVISRIRAYRHMVDHFVFVVDTDSLEERAAFAQKIRSTFQPDEQPAHLDIRHQPLAGDFGRQRNLVQEAAATEWVLQLDCDEKLDENLLRNLGWAIERAETTALLTVGFPRKNLVGGKLSAHYPDIQYRLNRRSVHYHKPVHEAPNVPWQRVGICWLGHIEHFLPKDRLEARSRKYEAMEAGAGKPANLKLLLTPFELPALTRPVK